MSTTFKSLPVFARYEKWRWSVVLVLGLTLLGCGGGTGDVAQEGVGSGGTGISSGSVDGFGSVIVDGNRLDDSSATIQVYSQPGNPNQPGVDDVAVRIGQQVVANTDASASVATSIDVLPLIIGQVESVDAVNNRLVVAGQTVSINVDEAHGAPTMFEGYDQLSDVSVGDEVIVHGHLIALSLNSASSAQASRIELIAASQTQVRVTGWVQNLNTSAQQFQLGGLTISYGASTNQLPSGATLSNGQRVVVWSSTAVSAGTLQAQIISTEQPARAGLPVRVGGLVSGCASASPCPSLIYIDGVAVNVHAATFTDAPQVLLADGDYATAVGVADAQTGVVAASKVKLRSTTDTDVTLLGTALDVVGTSEFLLRGVPVLIQPATVFASGCTLAQGQALQVQGSIVNNRVVAQTISCLSSLEGLTVDLTGIATNVNQAAHTFSLNGSMTTLQVQDAGASFVDGSASALASGQYVVVHGKVQGGVLVAAKVRFDTAPAAGEFETEGLAYAVNTSTFKVNGLLLNYQSSNVVGGSLSKGNRVRVRFTGSSNAGYVVVSVVLT